MKALIAAALMAVVSVGAASASTINFNVYAGWTKGSNTYSNGHETVEVSGWQYDGFSNSLKTGSSSTASWGGAHGGIGVCRYKTSSWCNLDQHKIDGFHGNDMALLDFGDKVVRLTSLTFAYADHNDKFDVLAFGNGNGSAATDYEWDIKIDGSGVKTVALSGLDTGSLFGIGAFSKKSEFKLQSVHYSVVPLPAAGWMLLAGLGGLAALKRRKNA